jgi:hypothetical protein
MTLYPVVLKRRVRRFSAPLGKNHIPKEHKSNKTKFLPFRFNLPRILLNPITICPLAWLMVIGLAFGLIALYQTSHWLVDIL